MLLLCQDLDKDNSRLKLEIIDLMRHELSGGYIKKNVERIFVIGYIRLFLVTEEAKNLYIRHKWEKLEQVKTIHGHAVLMSKDLS